MGQSKLYKQIRLMGELGPLCEGDRDNIACGYNEKGEWKAWIRLVPMQLALCFHAEWPKTDFYDLSHKQLDALRALKWKSANPLSTLDRMAKESATPEELTAGRGGPSPSTRSE